MSVPAESRLYLPFAEKLADAAAVVVARYFRQPMTVDQKADASPVTIADREAELAMRDLIRRTYPEHGIEGEEYGAVRRDALFVWCLDPIDGTRSFMTGRPVFGTLISLMYQGRPWLGIIDQCISKERWIGLRGEPSRWNGRPITVRPCPDIARASLYTTTPAMFGSAGERAAFERVAVAAAQAVYGGDCYAYGLLAMGFVDLIVEAGLDNHDYMALVPVIEGAGGIITDWRGEPLHARSSGQVVAAGDARTHEQALTLLKAAARQARPAPSL